MKLNYFLAVSGLVLLFACGGDDGPTAPASTTTLTQVQADALTEQLGFGVTAGSSFIKLSTRLQSSQTVEEQCEGGGKIVTTYSATSASASGGDFSTTSDYQDCKIPVEGGDPITANGEITNSGSVAASGFDSADDETFNVAYDANVVGLISVTGTGVTPGDCGIGVAMSIDIAVVSQDPTVTYSLSGTVCDTPVSDSGTETGDQV